MCLEGERAVDAVLRVIPGLGKGVQSGKKRVLGPLFKIDLHLLDSLFKKEQLIHRRLDILRRLAHSLQGISVTPVSAAGPPHWPGDWI